MPEESNNPELASVAAALASLAPSAGRLDRDQILFRAGQASAPRSRGPWPALCAALAAAAVVLGVFAVRQREPRTIERIVLVPKDVPVPRIPIARNEPAAPSSESANQGSDWPPPSPLSYYRLEQVASRWGVEELPVPVSSTVVEADTTPERMMERRMQDAYFSDITR
jgi:hypothetical protein